MASHMLYASIITPHPSSNLPKLPRPSSSSSPRLPTRLKSFKCKAQSSSSQSQTVYQGVYGPWSVDSTDVKEVILYRSGLVTAATSFVIAASTAFLPDSFLANEVIRPNLDYLYAIGAGGLGLSLVLIHIYVTEIKRTLQAFWGLGVVGSLAAYICLAQPAGEGLVQYVVDNPSAVWFVGPLFAALTGLVFKEGLCYGKLEAGLLTFIIPIVLLGHLLTFIIPTSSSGPLPNLPPPSPEKVRPEWAQPQTVQKKPKIEKRQKEKAEGEASLILTLILEAHECDVGACIEEERPSMGLRQDMKTTFRPGDRERDLVV